MCSALAYEFDCTNPRFLDTDLGKAEMTSDEFEDSVKAWCNRVGLVGEVHVDSYYASLKVPGVSPATFHLRLTPETNDVVIANEIGHLQLGTCVDPCFAGAPFEGPGNLDDPESEQFMKETVISQGVTDIFTDDLIAPLKDGFVADMIEANLGCLEEIDRSGDEWFTFDHLMNNTVCQAVALSAAALARMGIRDCELVERVSDNIDSEINEFFDKGMDIVRRLRSLYETVPELPKKRTKAVRLLEEVTQEAARILGHQVPHLEYSKTYNWHYWTRIEKLKLTKAEKHGILR